MAADRNLRSKWKVYTMLSQIAGNLGGTISYLDHNADMVNEHFGKDADHIMSVLRTVHSWMKEEADLIQDESDEIIEHVP